MTLKKFFGSIFLLASIAPGWMGWRVWREMGEHSVNILIVLICAFLSLFLLVVGVGFLRGQNPVKDMLWRAFIDGDE